MGDNSRYDDDPLLQARRYHYGKYQGHPEGRCCVGCEELDGGHTTFPCPVVNDGRCEFEFAQYRCIQAKHEDDRHLVEDRYGQRSVMSPADE